MYSSILALVFLLRIVKRSQSFVLNNCSYYFRNSVQYCNGRVKYWYREGFKSLKHINIYVKISDPTLQIFTYREGSWNTFTMINEGSLYFNYLP